MGRKQSSDLEQDIDTAIGEIEAKQTPATAAERIREMFAALDEWKEARANKDAVAKEQQENIRRVNAELKESVEASIPHGASLRDQAAKLRKIEIAWQDVEEAKGAKAEASKAARKRFKAAEGRLKDLIEESRQLRLFDGVQDEPDSAAA